MGMLVRSLDDYGGALADYASVVDPTTDEGARFRNRYACDGAMMMHTAFRAFVSFVTVNGANPTDPAADVHDALWGSTNTVKPTVARTGEGVWTATWPTTVTDALTAETAAKGGGVTHTVSFRRAIASTQPVGGVLTHARAIVTASNVVTVYGYLANGTADDIPGATIDVWVW